MAGWNTNCGLKPAYTKHTEDAAMDALPFMSMVHKCHDPRKHNYFLVREATEWPYALRILY